MAGKTVNRIKKTAAKSIKTKKCQEKALKSRKGKTKIRQSKEMFTKMLKLTKCREILLF